MPKKNSPAKKTASAKSALAPKKSKNKMMAKNSPAKKNVRTPQEKKPSDDSKLSKAKKVPSLLRGFKDIVPKDERYWLRMHRIAQDLARAYGYHYIETPILEEASLFIRSVGRGTDVVEKEMYMFEDRDGTKVTLRPEATASVARAYVNHGMQTLPQPVKVWYWGSMFRHDRPQAGRQRQFHQFSFENLGVHDPVVDAELISGAYNFLRDLGIATNVHINSIGTPADRDRYVIELVGYLRSKRSYLCEDCRRRINKNPLRCLDCKEESCRPVIDESPQIVDWLSDESKKFFMDVLEYLDELEIPYVLQSTLVRGLDYYTDTVFELYEDNGEEPRTQGALCGGGRYNGLVADLGGPATPGSGFSIGLERVVSALRKLETEEEKAEELDYTPIYFAQLGEQARKKALRLIEKLRRDGLYVRHNVGKTALKSQMESADKYGATHTLILGQKEVQDETIIVRDMESGIQEIIDQKKINQEVRRLVEKHQKK